MTTHEVLVAGRNALAAGDWCQRRYYDGDGGRCALGAIGEDERPGAPEVVGARDELAQAVGLAHGTLIPDWNDAPGRTKEEVLAAFDKAIAATSPQPPFETLQPEAPERAPELVA